MSPDHEIRPPHKKNGRPRIVIPVFFSPTDEDYEEFSKDPEGESGNSDTKSKATQRFYSSLRYPDSETELDLWEES